LDDSIISAEWDKLAPGMTATFQKDAPGMHRSNTVDLIYVISGRIVLELDDGVKVNLQAGDTLVQNGTRHAWHNPYDEPCLFITTQIGARRPN
jgi:quercetin dioxygenase-like cupin family protein